MGCHRDSFSQRCSQKHHQQCTTSSPSSNIGRKCTTSSPSSNIGRNTYAFSARKSSLSRLGWFLLILKQQIRYRLSPTAFGMYNKLYRTLPPALKTALTVWCQWIIWKLTQHELYFWTLHMYLHVRAPSLICPCLTWECAGTEWPDSDMVLFLYPRHQVLESWCEWAGYSANPNIRAHNHSDISTKITLLQHWRNVKYQYQI
jgi:hypothetical protein